MRHVKDQANIAIYAKEQLKMRFSQDVYDLSSRKPTVIGGMTREELDAEFMKGVESAKSGKSYTVEEADDFLTAEFGI